MEGNDSGITEQEKSTIQRALQLSQTDPGGPRAPGEKVVNLNVYKIQRALREEGFDLIRDNNGKLTLVLRMNSNAT
ncbi:MAG: hypothetical protein KDK37_01775 [Leptospiraceae bacterium]|nr:hypothetical protein [Leptospiraceae bacterium]MCB1302970.1 hypothetical protein [Leptospiraceae bacterium]